MKSTSAHKHLVSICAVLSGCHLTDLSAQITAPALPGAYGNVTAQIKTNASLLWATAFGDPKLNALLMRAMKTNLTIDQAHKRLVATRAVSRSSDAGFTPIVDVTAVTIAGSDRRDRSDMARRPVQVNLETSWEMPLFGQQLRTRLSADMSAAIAQSDVDAAQLAVASELTAHFIHLRALQHSVQNADQITALLENKEVSSKVRERSGFTPPGSSAATVARLQEARLKRQVLDSSIRDALQQIATLQGTATIDSSLLAIGPQPVISTAPVRISPSDALRSRPDVARAQFMAVKAGAEVGLAEAELYPKLRLGGTIGIGTPVSGSIFALMGGPSLQVPIFDYGKRLDNVSASKALFQEALSAYRNNVLVAYEEASRALRAYQTSRTKTEIARTQVEAAKQRAQKAGVLLREGLSSNDESQDSRIELLEMQGHLIVALEEESLALVTFYKETGLRSAFVKDTTLLSASTKVKS